MKFFLGLWMFLVCLPIWSNPCNIAFIHLGEKVPSCLFIAIKQARFMNPDCKIHLLMDQTALRIVSFPEPEFLRSYNVSLVNLGDIPLTQEHRVFKNINKIDPLLLDGFWLYTLERFFYLFDFISAENLQNVFHFESDTLLYTELEEILPFFDREKIKLAAPFQSTVGCIPCCVFIRGQNALAPLIHHILHKTETYIGKTSQLELGDMQILANFFALFGDSYMTPLPILMSEYIKHFAKRTSTFEPDKVV